MSRIIFIFCLVCLCLFYGNAAGQGNNCPAFALCTTASFTNTPGGFGTQELGASNQGCLSTEHQSVWISVTISTPGTLQFTINPNTNSDDFDFAVWGPAAACPPTTAPIRCSWAVKNNNFAGTGDNGNTGINSVFNSTHPLAGENDNSESAGGNGWVNDIAVTAGQTYLVLVDNFSANNGFVLSWTGTSTFTCTVLPVELIYFKGNREMDNRNQLNWKTATENNNAYFTVERSSNGIGFDQVIAQVPGAGNSNHESEYRIYDEYPPTGINYYRLRQTDLNGNYTYSELIAIDNTSTRKKIVAVYNPLGQRVDRNAAGIKYILYADGTVLKKID
jgi:hypothetical protein